MFIFIGWLLFSELKTITIEVVYTTWQSILFVLLVWAVLGLLPVLRGSDELFVVNLVSSRPSIGTFCCIKALPLVHSLDFTEFVDLRYPLVLKLAISIIFIVDIVVSIL